MNPTRRFLAFLAVLLPASVLVFLLGSGFFDAWDGRVATVRPASAAEEPAAWRVMIVGEDGTARERTWASDVVVPLARPVDTSGLPPLDVPEDAPQTRKERFQLFFLVQNGEGSHDVVPTTSPTSLGLAVLVLVAGVALRNLFVSGSPVSITPRSTRLPAPAPPPGQVVRSGSARSAASEKGPPPSRRRRGRGRR